VNLFPIRSVAPRGCRSVTLTRRRDFIAQSSPNAELWSYAAVWKSEFGVWEQREGYVALRSGKLALFFETARYRLDEELQAAASV